MAYQIGNRQYELMGNRQLLNEVMGLFILKIKNQPWLLTGHLATYLLYKFS